uniref:ADAM metallopeptidase domain 11 n=1 Tax=Sander lucioperca TaxID=283035 RepID=A0A8C9ZTT5_SANLU
MCLPGCSVNSTKHGHVEGDSELGDGDDWSEEEKPIFTEGLRRSKRQVRRGQRTVQTETKYIELMVVNDHELVGVKLLSPYLCNCCMKPADLYIYKEQLNTRIVLVAMETWSSENRVSVGDDALLTLRDFMKYRKESIKERCDTVHLFSWVQSPAGLVSFPSKRLAAGDCRCPDPWLGCIMEDTGYALFKLQ